MQRQVSRLLLSAKGRKVLDDGWQCLLNPQWPDHPDRLAQRLCTHVHPKQQAADFPLLTTVPYIERLLVAVEVRKAGYF